MKKKLKIKVKNGQHVDTINETLNFMRKQDIYDFEENLVSIEKGKLLIHDKHTLAYWLANRIQYTQESFNKNGTILSDMNPPLNWCEQILSLKDHRNLKKIKSIITAPIISQDGRIILKGGYDEKAQLYFDDSLCNISQIHIPETPTRDELTQALNTILVPFDKFPYTSNLDRSVMLAAVLTAIMRPTLNICPGFGFDAPSAGTGKTLLAQTIGQLMLNSEDSILTYAEDDSRGDEETRKRVFSALMSAEKCMLIDNIQKPFDSRTLAVLTTSSTYTDRKLGSSHNRSFPVKMLVFLTGNNLMLSKDLERRFPLCRIDAKTEQTQTRTFSLRPISHVKENRMKLVSSGLTLIKGWLNTPEFKQRKIWVTREIESFDEWDRIIGQTVAWIASQNWSQKDGDAQFCDVAPAFTSISRINPEEETVSILLGLLYQAFENKSFTVQQLLDKAKLPEYKSLEDNLLNLSSSDKLNPISVGKLLSNRKGQIKNGLSIKALPKIKNTSVWKIETTLTTINKGLQQSSA